MALPTGTAPHSGPVDQPGEGAYLWARSGLARSATTRSNYVSIQTAIDWIIRDDAGSIISTADISGVILRDTLRVTQALNDEPDSCSFTLQPQAPATALIPALGHEIRISWAPGAPALFHGYVVTSQADWRLKNRQPPWVAVQCQDPMWRFDARIVTYQFPAQSVSASIAFLVQWFCNGDTPGPLDFSLAFVEPAMPSIPAFDVVNQRPSTVMRTLMAAVGGGFYLEGLTVHAWAQSVSEPNQSNPQPLTVGLTTLHTFQKTDDATQIRRRVIVEGRRTNTLISLPALPTSLDQEQLGVAVQDATLFDLSSPSDNWQLIRMGTQWMHFGIPVSVTGAGKNPPQGKTQIAYVVGQQVLYMKAMPMIPPSRGWIRVGNQTARYVSIMGSPAVDGWWLTLTDPVAYPQYAHFTSPLPAGETVEWLDGGMSLIMHGLSWATPGVSDMRLRAHPVDTPVVTVARAITAPGGWPALEGFVQDGRYSYAGAQARADADLAAFQDPLVSVEWETDDLNALPGRSQVIALSSPTFTPAINTTVTILRVDISFPLRTLPPRRRCTGGVVKTSSFLDLVVTTQD